MKHVTVLIPAYQALNTIGAAVESILDSNLAKKGAVEVIVAPDDGLSDYQDVFAAESRVVVLPVTEAIGPGASRNRAERIAQGEWLTTLDADDTVSSGYLDVLLEAAHQQNYPCVFSRMRYCESSEKVIRQMPGHDFVNAEILGNFAGSLMAFHQRDMWIDHPDSLAEDIFVASKLLDALDNRIPLAPTKYNNMVHGESLCACTPQADFNQAYALYVENAPQDSAVHAVFRRKLEIGRQFSRYQLEGGNLSFHEFMRDVALVSEEAYSTG